jgi:lipopolysaccharide transport system ATP-binding protein
MASTIIEVEHIAKQFIIGHEGIGRYSTIREEISKQTKKIFSFPKRFESRKSTSLKEVFFALEDISFKVQKGERLGIVGRNGAGKSTLLKILSRITEPSAGVIKIRGRVASLLEVGTGFHPELSGRENIFLNGAILGMSRTEIRKKFDEIVDFAEVEKFLDTPVKRYSSGMYVRLAFAVAAHLEPEILVVDEVLAVGDAQFQRKCLGKMQDVSQNEGRTVLFVSHNIPSLLQLCENGILLQEGKMDFIGNISDTIDRYINNASKYIEYAPEIVKRTGFKKIEILNENRKPSETHRFDQKIIIEYVLQSKDVIQNTHLSINVYDNRQRAIFSSDHLVDYSKVKDEEYRVTVEIPEKVLLRGTYFLNTALHVPGIVVVDKCIDRLFFSIEDSGSELSIYNGQDYGVVYVKLNWKING